MLRIDTGYLKPRPVRKSSSGAGKILLVAYFDPKGLSTITENIEAWTTLSGFDFDILNLFGGIYPHGFELPSDLQLERYDGLLIHCTVAYSPSNLRSLDQSMKKSIRDYRGLKILMKQDEHYRTHETVDYISSRSFDIVLTVVDRSAIEDFYPSAKMPKGLSFHYALTGYVSDQMLKQQHPKLADRPIDIGYRGSIQGWQLGRLGYEKREIGDRFVEVCRRFGLTSDISSRWEDRFFGQKWFRFLGSVRAVLGVESGSSIADFDGSLEEKCALFLKQHPDASFEKLEAELLAPYEENIFYKTISPRHFEAAATKTVQILYEGNYSGIFVPDRHYISLKRDFSNIEEVVAKFRDGPFCEALVENAHREIVANPKYHYRSFVSEVDALIRSKLESRVAFRDTPARNKNLG
jgi:hypothetical protein